MSFILPPHLLLISNLKSIFCYLYDYLLLLSPLLGMRGVFLLLELGLEPGDASLILPPLLVLHLEDGGLVHLHGVPHRHQLVLHVLQIKR